MRGDFSRNSFDPARHAHGVLMQQGRVQLDADWNESQAVASHRVETGTVDVVGPTGVPKLDNGFAVTLTQPDQLTVGTGRIYVDGLLVDNDKDVAITAQPHLPGYALPTAAGCYVAFLDAWLAAIGPLDDPSIREVALGGPDTALRDTVLWQVKLLRVGDPDPNATCASAGGLGALTGAVPGTLKARARTGTTGTDPCTLAPESAFRGLENQLYRVEIHQGGGNGTATFKWSRDNASLVADWLPDDVGVNRIKVGSVGRDGMPGFVPNQWVELLDDTNELFDDTGTQHDRLDPTGRPGTLIQLGHPAQDQVLTLLSAPPMRGNVHPRVRGWDMPSDAIAIRTADPADFIDLENGIQVQFDQAAVYRAGDYWLIPARTVTADIEWPGTPGSPAAKRPDGIRHHYTPLAVLSTPDGAQWTMLDDCRPLFPSLTAICAEDVRFDDTACALPGATTVQDALDALCDRSDLKKHNRHLHGWGIVCGLAVHCGPNKEGEDRRRVTVQPGYAIDAQGNDVDVDAEFTVDILDWVDRISTPKDAVLTNGNGEVALILDPTARPDPIRVEKFDPKADDLEFRTGTLLHDFLDECVKPVQDFLKTELSGDKDHPADAAQQRLAALINLANQAINPVSGQQVFISQREDAMIRQFYAGLRALLSSQTFCAMFANARTMPPYPLAAVKMDTIFGTGNHNRLRLHPNGREAYTFGPGTNPLKPHAIINRYDLERRLLVAEIDPVAGTERTTAEKPDNPPDTGTGAVLDIAFSPDGTRIHVAIASRNEDNTIFRSGTLSAAGVQWGSPVTICGKKLVSLATTAVDPGVVYAVGLQKVTVTQNTGKGTTTHQEWRSAGLLRLIPDQIDPNNPPVVPLAGDMVPTGPLLIDVSGAAVFTTTAPDRDATRYTGLARVVLPIGQGPPRWDASFGTRSGSDGIALFAADPGKPAGAVFAVIDQGATKQVLEYRMNDGAQVDPGGNNGVDGTDIGLAGARGHLLVTEYDANSVRMMDPASDTFVAGFRLPTQVGPAAVAATRNDRVVVLNQVSNTLTVIEPNLIDPQLPSFGAELADYRAKMLDAFADLLGGFLQYLKDCLCDHLLVHCPTPTGTEKLRLGCVSIRDNEVYKICSLTGRRYVKSFPTIGYWLSLVPIQALIARAVEMLCCAVLPEWFSERSAADRQGGDFMSTSTLMRLVETAQTNDLSGWLSDLGSRFGTATRTAMLAVRSVGPSVPPPGGPTVKASTLIGQPVDQVAAALRERGVTVRQARFDPRLGVQTVGTVAGMFRSPQPGQEVTLCEEDGQVRFFSVADPSPLASRVNDLETTVAARDAEIGQLRESLASAQQILAHVQDLHTQVTAARAELEQRDQALVDLRTRLETVERAQGSGTSKDQ
jgi:hypothetical protein